MVLLDAVTTVVHDYQLVERLWYAELARLLQVFNIFSKHKPRLGHAVVRLAHEQVLAESFFRVVELAGVPQRFNDDFGDFSFISGDSSSFLSQFPSLFTAHVAINKCVSIGVKAFSKPRNLPF